MQVQVEKAFSRGTGRYYTGGAYSVWVLSFRVRGQVRTLRCQGDLEWNRISATAALDLLAVELPEVSRSSIRFSVK